MPMRNHPRVIINFVMTADGKVSTRKWTPTGFGSAADQKRLQEIRARGDALMVGRKTAEIDQMLMGISQPELRQARMSAGRPAEPLRVLISGSGRLKLQMKAFSEMRSPLLIFTKVELSSRMQKALPRGVIVHTLRGKEFSIKAILSILYRRYRVRTLVCEGGPTLMHTLLKADLVREINLTITPLVFGGHGAPTLSGLPGKFLARPLDFRLKSMEVIEGECFLIYERK
jgi:2,5-diamino-6-(ribosylamino)-4(3H)-pyrimidinone 5'-phosphate reductase